MGLSISRWGTCRLNQVRRNWPVSNAAIDERPSSLACSLVSEETVSDSQQLPKVMGWPGVALFTVSWTIGSAIFRVPSEIATYAGSADRMLVLWLVGLLLALAGAVVYLELAVRLPRSGGNV